MKLQVYTLFIDSFTGSGSYLSPKIGHTIRSCDFPDDQQYFIQGIISDIEPGEDGHQLIQFQITIDCSATDPWTRVGETFTLDLSPNFEATWGIDRVTLVDPRDPWDNHNPFYDPHYTPDHNVVAIAEFLTLYQSVEELLDHVVFLSPFVEDEGDHLLDFHLTDKRPDRSKSCKLQLTASSLQHLLWDKQASKVYLTHIFRSLQQHFSDNF